VKVEQKMPGFRLSNNMILTNVLAVVLCFALAGSALAAGDEISALASQYSPGAKQCLDCHTKLKGNQTAHYISLARMDSADSRAFPMADGKHYCEACHGPSAAHSKKQAAGNRVPTLMSFSQDSPAQETNTVCLACHDDQPMTHWMGSPHNIEGTACVDCHDVHADFDQVLSVKTQSGVCYDCHEDKKRAVQADSTLHIIENDESSCSGCHDSHADLDVMQCLNCHEQNTETLATQSSKARGFHRTTIKNNLSCVRCHGGVAHGVPEWVETIREEQQKSDD